MRITVPEDTGRVRVLQAPAQGDVKLVIVGDSVAPEHKQWFCFDAHGDVDKERVIILENAGETTYADALEGYSVCASYEPEGPDWFRVDTEFHNGQLRLIHTPRSELVRYAYFAPYPRTRRNRVIEEARASGRVRVRRLGKSIEGRGMDLLTFGSESDDAMKLWVVAQQHPGETMAGWFAEGLIGRLLATDDPLVAALLLHARVNVIACMNPDVLLSSAPSFCQCR